MLKPAGVGSEWKRGHILTCEIHSGGLKDYCHIEENLIPAG